jgi:thymidylate kinase
MPKLTETPTVLEIGGPAGAGKTTLFRALAGRYPSIVDGVRLSKAKCLPFAVGDVMRLLPAYLRQRGNSRWFTRREARSMAYLRAWHYALSRNAQNRDGITIFVHGPIFRLVLLREMGPEITRSEGYRVWWDEVFRKWAATLNMVVWLDAPHHVLIDRIRSRRRWQRLSPQEKAEQTDSEFLARYRRSCEQILARATAEHDVRLLRFDTRQNTTDQIADEVLSALGSLVGPSRVAGGRSSAEAPDVMGFANRDRP